MPEPSTTGVPCAIQIRNLSKTYKTGFWFTPKITHALKNLHLDVYENQAFGLMGLEWGRKNNGY